MATMQAECGHAVSVEWLTGGDATVTIKEHYTDGQRATSYRVVCPECRKVYEQEKLILETEQDKNKWLRIKRGRNGKRIKAQ